MLLQNKIRELTAFLNKQAEELRAFLQKWEKELRADLGLAKSAETTIGLSFLPGLELTRIPDAQSVLQGMYQTEDGLQVEVLAQHPETGLVAVELLDPESDTERFQSISPGLFKRMFQYVPPNPTVEGQALSFHTEEITEVDEQRRQQVAAWHRSFEWEAIHEAYDGMRDKLLRLDNAVMKKDQNAAQADYLEMFFLFYIMGNRLGFSCEQSFTKLHKAIFDLVDRTEEDAMKTKSYYNSKGIRTNYRELLVYDPSSVLAPPDSYFVTYATQPYESSSGHIVAEGGFLRSHR